MKLCRICNTEKQIDEFNKCKRDGVQARCKSCEKKYRDSRKEIEKNIKTILKSGIS
jgi:hypothetical protein